MQKQTNEHTKKRMKGWTKEQTKEWTKEHIRTTKNTRKKFNFRCVQFFLLLFFIGNCQSEPQSVIR
jgi:hypothetical protein